METATQNVIGDSLDQWITHGQQELAVDLLRPLADTGDRAALSLICWFYHQMSERWREGLPYAMRALEMGLPHVSTYFYGNMLNDPELRRQTPDLLKPAIAAGWPTDPLGNIPALWQQGERETSYGLLDAASIPRPFPLNEWASELVDDLNAKAEMAATQSIEIANHAAAVGATRQDVETRAAHLKTLIEQATNAESMEIFDAEAKANKQDSDRMFSLGVYVLIAAAVLSIFPVVAYWVAEVAGRGPFLDRTSIVASHLGPAIALGALAGVLLARSRGRDRARERAKTLAVAFSVMFAHSAQVANQDEKQRFVHDMGRTIIEAFVGHDSPASTADDSRNILDALRAPQ